MDHPEKPKDDVIDAIVPVAPARSLTDRERRALEAWRKRGDAPIPLDESIRMYELYLNGYSCEQIEKTLRSTNPNIPSYSLGQLVNARIDHDWDERRLRHLNELYEEVNERVRKTKADVTSFLSDVLTVTHVEEGEKLRRWLVSHKDADKSMFQVSGIGSYKEVLALFMNISGLSNKGRRGRVTNPTQVNVFNGPTKEESPKPAGKLSPKSNEALLELLDGPEPEDA
jgi:hypothetical protein